MVELSLKDELLVIHTNIDDGILWDYFLFIPSISYPEKQALSNVKPITVCICHKYDLCEDDFHDNIWISGWYEMRRVVILPEGEAVNEVGSTFFKNSLLVGLSN